MLARIFATDHSYAILAARLFLALVMFPHGAQKALGLFGGHGFAATMENMSQMLPAPLVLLVIAIEFLGPIVLLFGLLARPAALGYIAVMLGAIFTAHIKNGFFMNWFGQQAGEGIEYHLLMIGLALVVLIAGAGAFSADRAIARKLVG